MPGASRFFLRFLLPTGLDARQNLFGLRYIACAPETDGPAFDDLQFRSLDDFLRDVPLQGHECNAHSLRRYAGGDSHPDIPISHIPHRQRKHCSGGSVSDYATSQMAFTPRQIEYLRVGRLYGPLSLLTYFLIDIG